MRNKQALYKIFALMDSFIDCPDAEAHLVCGERYFEVANLFDEWAKGRYSKEISSKELVVFGNKDDKEVGIFFWKLPPTHNFYYKNQIIDISNHWMLG